MPKFADAVEAFAETRDELKAETARQTPQDESPEERGPGEPPHLTDLGNALRLVNRFGDQIRWCKALGWLAWDGRRWTRDERMATMQFAALNRSPYRIASA